MLEKELAEIEKNYHIENSYHLCIKFMLASLSLVDKHSFPSVALDALIIANNYWENRVGKTKLESARVACWNYLDEISESTTSTDKNSYAVRAVICTLYIDPPSGDIIEILEWFIQMISNLGDYKVELENKLNFYFPKQITRSD